MTRASPAWDDKSGTQGDRRDVWANFESFGGEGPVVKTEEREDSSGASGEGSCGKSHSSCEAVSSAGEEQS